MVKVEIGTVIPKSSVKQGQTKEAKVWLCGQIKAERGYDSITVWASNAEAMVARDCDFRILEITGASVTNRKYVNKQGEEKWAVSYNVNAKLEPYNVSMEASSDDNPVEGFSQIDDDSIPF